MNSSNWASFLIALVAFILVFLIVAKLYSPTVATSAIVAAIVGILLFLICAGYFKANWTAVTATAAVLAIIWAVWHQEIRYIIRSPKIDITFLEPNKPHLTKLTGISLEKGDVHIAYEGEFIACVITNRGKEIAHGGQIHLTKIAQKAKDGKWKCDLTWIPIPLKWVLPLSPNLLHIELFRDLVPLVPYPFTVGSFSKNRSKGMHITYITANKSTKEVLEPGEYCLELTVYGKSIDPPAKRYLHFNFDDFSKESDLATIKKHILFVDWVEKFPKCEIDDSEMKNKP